jgi:hypothetical protein
MISRRRHALIKNEFRFAIGIGQDDHSHRSGSKWRASL